MSRPRRSWFLAPRAPNFDCSPGGYIGLGSIIEDPLRPGEPVIQEVPAPLPNSLYVDKTQKIEWETLKERAKEGKLGVWAEFLQFIGVEDVSANWMTLHVQSYRMDKLETGWFLPTNEYVASQMCLPKIASNVSSCSSPPDLFMITAIRIARGLSFCNRDETKQGPNLNAGFDLTAAGGPGVTAGFNNEVSWSHKSAKILSDVIFAYRLSKIRFERKSIFAREREFKHAPYEPRKGTVFEEMNKTDEPEDSFYISNVEIDRRDLTAQDLELDDTKLVADEYDGEDCECILPE